MLGMELRDPRQAWSALAGSGLRVAEICGLGLKMKILAYDPYISNVDMPGVEFTNDLNDLLARARNVPTLHLPSTPDTHHLIGESQLRRMHPGVIRSTPAWPGRGRSRFGPGAGGGHLSAAGVDVFDPEPPAGDNPLLQMRNVVCTPHIVLFTDKGQAAMRKGTSRHSLLLPGRMGTWESTCSPPPSTPTTSSKSCTSPSAVVGESGNVASCRQSSSPPCSRFIDTVSRRRSRSDPGADAR